MKEIALGIVGGAIVLLANKRAGLQTAAVSAGKAGEGVISRFRFCTGEVIENLRDLAAESKLELEAEQAALDEVRLHNKTKL
jgi:hypothetical protein